MESLCYQIENLVNEDDSGFLSPPSKQRYDRKTSTPPGAAQYWNSSLNASSYNDSHESAYTGNNSSYTDMRYSLNSSGGSYGQSPNSGTMVSGQLKSLYCVV